MISFALLIDIGRLLQHMDETVGFDCSTLQTLGNDNIILLYFKAILIILINIHNHPSAML